MARSKMQSADEVSEAVFFWSFPDGIKYKRNVWWYVVSLIVLGLLIAWSLAEGRWFGDRNYIFAVFLVLFYLVAILNNFHAGKEMEFIITPDGVKLADRFYYYKEFDNFYIIYEEGGVRSLYLEFINPLKGRIVAPLLAQDPVAIRDFLLKYLREDLDREVEPLSERVRHWLKF